MRLSIAAVAQVALTGALVHAASTFSPARPPAIPLAVRSPYVNTWLPVGKDGGNGGYLAGEWAQSWSQHTNGWVGLIRVDGTPYTWMGAAANGPAAVDQTEFSYTSTRSTFIMNVGGKVGMNITFMSPVTPNDLKRQSLTFSYLDVGVHSLDGSTHNVEIYTDVSGEWASGDDSAVIQWDYNTSNGVAYHTIARQQQNEMAEDREQAAWGTWYYSTADGPGLTYQSGIDNDVRANFAQNGVLSNSKDTNFRAVSNQWPVFGFTKKLGAVGSESVSTVFSIGLTQENAISFLGEGSGLTTVPSLWKSYFSNGLDAMTFFYNDYATASSLSTDLDNRVASDSTAAAGQDYLTITSLSVRQTFGALQFCGTDSAPLVFLKEISSNSDIQTVDVMFPSMPLILYTNPKLLAYLLNPLFINQENGHYPNKNAIHDLGTFPNAKGYPAGNDELMPLEECGNMIIMSLVYAQRTGDTGYLNTHYTLLKQWAAYLVDDSLVPANQISTDDFAGSLANQTNLAIKGIIGLRAMSEIAKMTGNSDDEKSFGDTASSYLTQWQSLGINQNANPPHTTLSYGDGDSHGLLYNLYANSLLGFGTSFVPQSVYDMQSAFYPTVALEYGVPLDTRHSWVKSDWMMFAAAISSSSTRDMFIKKLANWIGVTPTNRPLTDLYDGNSGDFPGITFNARPVVGGHFALLALPN
ncbi:hypothetical protein PG990_006557 [Apiospora arundinis]|uniref:DUF1793-domain-containing protein n=1 Tax=Apiospora arundinis TaxID=335852 RepID=A0ABR2JB81_9PEZI